MLLQILSIPDPPSKITYLVYVNVLQNQPRLFHPTSSIALFIFFFSK
jgi:hypothetical protein